MTRVFASLAAFIVGLLVTGATDATALHGISRGGARGQGEIWSGIVPPADTEDPTDPTSLVATTINSSEIDLAWTASTDNIGVDHYNIERCTGAGCSSFSQVDTSGTNSYNDTGLSASTSYTYRVYAEDAAGNVSGASNEDTDVTDAGVASLASQSATMAAGEWRQLTTNNVFDDVSATPAQIDAICAADPNGCDIAVYITSTPGYTTIRGWSSAAWDDSSKIGYFWGGGHNYGSNDVYSLDLGSMTWTQETLPAALNFTSGEYSLPTDGDSNGVPDSPAAQHSYDSIEWDPVNGKVFVIDNNTQYPFGGPHTGISNRSWYFDPADPSWDSYAATTYLYYPQCVYEVAETRMFCISNLSTNTKRIWMYNPATGAETDCGSNWTTNTPRGDVGTMFYDATDEEYYLINQNGLWKINMAGCSTTATQMAEPSERIVAAMGYDAITPFLTQSCPFRAGDYIYFWNTHQMLARYYPSGDSWDMIWNADYENTGPAVLSGQTFGEDRAFTKCHYFNTEGVMVGFADPKLETRAGVWMWKPGDNPADINKLDVDSIALDGQTQNSLSVHLAATGDKDYDSTAYVEYQEVGAGSWTRGPDMFRQFPEAVRIERGLPANPQGFDTIITGLTPGTDYNVRAVFADADGLASGSATSPQTLSSVSTLDTPTSDYTGFTYTYVSSTSASALNAAIQTACDSPGTAHVFEIDAGVTIDGPIIIRPTTNGSSNVCGTATTPFILRGANQATSKVDAGGGSNIAVWVAADYVTVENLTTQNAKTSVAVYGLSNDRELSNVTIRDVVGTSTAGGVVTAGFYISDMVVTNNEFTGPLDPLETVTGGEGYGVEISGHNITVSYNTIQGFIDSIGVSDPQVVGADYLNYSFDIHHNLVNYGGDDGVETDFSHRNVSVHDNLLVNVGDCFSSQPAWGGPVYVVMNVCYNFERYTLKIKDEEDHSNGHLVLNNTFLNSGPNLQNTGTPAVGMSIINNIFAAEGTLVTPYNTAGKAMKLSGLWKHGLNTVDYNAWGQTSGVFSTDYQEGTSFSDYQSDGDWSAHGIDISGEIGTMFSFVPDFDDTGSGYTFSELARDPTGKNFDLDPGSSAVGAGLEIPGITPAGVTNPDMGACQASGCPAADYGVQ